MVSQQAKRQLEARLRRNRLLLFRALWPTDIEVDRHLHKSGVAEAVEKAQSVTGQIVVEKAVLAT